ncbi:MAG TPA: CDP-alcohol phosphatidyltransferase family protein [Vicinamibacteria bacterium]
MRSLRPSALVLLLVLAIAVFSLVVYAASGSRRDADADRRGSRFLMGAGDFLVHWFLWALSPLDRVAKALRLTPDAFNVFGLLFGLASGIAIGSGHLELGGWAILLGGVCDIMDGRVARAQQLSSPYGAFIDSTLDRFVEVFVFLGFVFYLRAFAYGPLLAAGAITGSLLVSYTRARGESVGVLCKEGLMQRAERLVLTFAACMLDGPVAAALGWPPGTLALWILGLIAAGTFTTAAHRTLWIASRLRAKA